MNLIKGTKYAVREVKENYEDWLWWKKRVQHRIIGDIFYEKIVSNDGVYVMEEDWDNLILLDAAGYEIFQKIFNEQEYGGKVASKISRGSATPQFLKENFGNNQYPDTVYVTGNPMVDLHVGNRFHELISVWKSSWNEKEGTVLPEDVYDVALEAKDRFPNKRIIVHFMQPHWPFVDTDITDESVGFGATRAKVDENIDYNKSEKTFGI